MGQKIGAGKTFKRTQDTRCLERFRLKNLIGLSKLERLKKWHSLVVKWEKGEKDSEQLVVLFSFFLRRTRCVTSAKHTHKSVVYCGVMRERILKKGEGCCNKGGDGNRGRPFQNRDVFPLIQSGAHP